MAVAVLPDSLFFRHTGSGWELSGWETSPFDAQFLIQEIFDPQEELDDPLIPKEPILLGEVSLNFQQAEALYNVLGAALMEALERRNNLGGQ